jgi:hypothetical protein
VAVIHASPAYAACGGDIRIGTSVSGRITSGACYYYFYGSAQQRVVITMRRSSTSLDPYLKLHDPNGKFLASDDDSGGQYDARISYRLPYKGWYRITATSYDGKDKGSFTLSAAQP